MKTKGIFSAGLGLVFLAGCDCDSVSDRCVKARQDAEVCRGQAGENVDGCISIQQEAERACRDSGCDQGNPVSGNAGNR